MSWNNLCVNFAAMRVFGVWLNIVRLLGGIGDQTEFYFERDTYRFAAG